MKSLDNIRYRLAERTDAQAFCALSNSLYARKVAPEYFFWQFFDNPNDPALVLAHQDAEVLGAFGIHTVGDGARRRTMCIDIMLAKAAQGRGLISGLTQAATAFARARGSESIAVVGNEKAYRALTRRLGWQLLEPLRTYEIAADAVDVEADRSCERLTSLPDLPAPQGAFYPRDAAYLTWRTISNPRYNYTWLQFAGNNRLPPAWCVTKVFQDPISGRRYGDILEIFSSDYSGPVFAGHVMAFASALKERQADLISVLPNRASQSAALSALGFAPGGPTRYLMAEKDMALAVCMLDIDVF